jgi:hypothetical protein
MVHGDVLGCAKAPIEIFHEARMFESMVFAHHDGMHDRKDTGTLVVLFFHCLVIREEARDTGRVVEDASRHVS